MRWMRAHAVGVIIYVVILVLPGRRGAQALSVRQRQPVDVADVYRDNSAKCAGCCGGEGSLSAFLRGLSEQRRARTAVVAGGFGSRGAASRRLVPGARGGRPPGAHGFTRCCKCSSGEWSHFARRGYLRSGGGGKLPVANPVATDPTDIEVLTVDVRLAKLVRESPTAFAAEVAALLGVPSSRISIDLPDEPKKPVLPVWPPRVAPAPAPASTPAPAPAPPPATVAQPTPANKVMAASFSSPLTNGSDLSCFEIDIDYACNDVNDSSWQQTPQACQDRCAQVPECSFFTYYSDSGDCYLKSSDAGRTLAVKATSGPKAGCALFTTVAPPSPAASVVPEMEMNASWQPCIQKDVDIAGSPISSCAERRSTQSSALACQAACVNSSFCEFFTWRSDTNNCFLKSSDEGRMEGVTFAFSGPKVCPSTGFQPMPAPAPAPLLPPTYFVEMLTREPCLIRGLRGRPKFYAREIAAMLDLAPEEVILEPPLLAPNSAETSCGIDPDILDDPTMPDAGVAALISGRSRMQLSRDIAAGTSRTGSRPPSLRGSRRGVSNLRPAPARTQPLLAVQASNARNTSQKHAVVRLAFFLGGLDYTALVSNATILKDFQQSLCMSVLPAMVPPSNSTDFMNSSRALFAPSPPAPAPAPAPHKFPTCAAASRTAIEVGVLAGPEPGYVASIVEISVSGPVEAEKVVALIEPFTGFEKRVQDTLSLTASLEPIQVGDIIVAGMDVDVANDSSVPLNWDTQVNTDLAVAVRLSFVAEHVDFVGLSSTQALYSKFVASIRMMISAMIGRTKVYSASLEPSLQQVRVKVSQTFDETDTAVIVMIPAHDEGDAHRIVTTLMQSSDLNSSLAMAISPVISNSAASLSSAVAIGFAQIDIVSSVDETQPQSNTSSIVQAGRFAVRVGFFVDGLVLAALQASPTMLADFTDSVKMTFSMALEPPSTVAAFLSIDQVPVGHPDVDVTLHAGQLPHQLGVLAFVPAANAADAERVAGLLSPESGLDVKLAMTLDGMVSLTAARSGDISVRALQADVVDVDTPAGRGVPPSWETEFSHVSARNDAGGDDRMSVPTTPEPMNRAWVAMWRLGLPYEEYDRWSQRLVAMVNMPHGPFDTLLPLTLARFPGVGLTRPRSTSLHLGALLRGDLKKHLFDAAVATQEKARDEIEYGLAVRKAIQAQEARLGAAIHGASEALSADAFPYAEVAPPNFNGRSFHGPWKASGPIVDRGFGF